MSTTVTKPIRAPAMTWWKRKRDPFVEREKSLAAEIAALESQIKRLDSRLQREHAQPGPAPRRPAAPGSQGSTAAPAVPPAELAIASGSRGVLNPRHETPATPQHFNELGVRKYDLLALFDRLRNGLRGPTPANPQLLKMLAAGNIEGLRPLRVEKRKARRRFLLLAALLFVVLLGIVSVFVRHG
jgi:hypothetical protein